MFLILQERLGIFKYLILQLFRVRGLIMEEKCCIFRAIKITTGSWGWWMISNRVVINRFFLLLICFQNVEKSLRLIAEVERRPALWQKRSEFYKNGIRRRDAWTEIDGILELTVEESSYQWRKLLTSYRTYKSKLRKSQQSGAGTHQI